MDMNKKFRQSNYLVFSNGEVKTIPHVVIKSNGNLHPVKETVLRAAKDKKGYLRVGLSIDRKLVTMKVHRLVAECFIENPYGLPQVNHKDGNKQNNNVENLEWVTNSQNILHAFKAGLIKNIYGKVDDKKNFPRGEKNHRSKLTYEKVNAARIKRNNGESFQSIANEFGVCKKTIMQAIKGKTWIQF